MSVIDTETIPCLVCGSSDFIPRFRLRDWAYGLPGEFQLVTCRACGHVYQTPRPTQPAIGLFYPDSYQPYHRTVRESLLWIRIWRHVQFRERCLQVARLCSGGRLLDVGCSTGLFLKEMRHYGDWTLAGVEANTLAAQYAHDVFGLDIFCGQIEHAPWQRGSFDVITLWDVLEHLPNPQTALRRIRNLLTDEGWLIVSVPNADSIDARLFGRYWIGLDAPRHLSVFSLNGLKRLFTETGFELEKAYCFYGRYTTFALSVQQLLRAQLKAYLLRELLEKMLFIPIWRYLTLPYFWVVDQLGLGAIITVRARAKHP